MPRNNKKKNNNKKKKNPQQQQQQQQQTQPDGVVEPTASASTTISGVTTEVAAAAAPAPVDGGGGGGGGGGGPFWSLSSTSSPTTTTATDGPAAPPPKASEEASALPSYGAAVGTTTETIEDSIEINEDVANKEVGVYPAPSSSLLNELSNAVDDTPTTTTGTTAVVASNETFRAKLNDEEEEDTVSGGENNEQHLRQDYPTQRLSASTGIMSSDASIAASFMDDLEEYAASANRRRLASGGDDNAAAVTGGATTTASASSASGGATTDKEDDIMKLKKAAAYSRSTGDDDDDDGAEALVLKKRQPPPMYAAKIDEMTATTTTSTSNTEGITTTSFEKTTPPTRAMSATPDDDGAAPPQPRRAVSTPVGAFRLPGRNNRGEAPRRASDFYNNVGGTGAANVADEMDNLAQPSTEFSLQQSRSVNVDGRRASKIDENDNSNSNSDALDNSHFVVPEATLVEGVGSGVLTISTGGGDSTTFDGDGEKIVQLTKEEFEKQLQNKVQETISNQVVAEATKMEEGEGDTGMSSFTKGIVLLGVVVVLIVVITVAVSTTRNRNNGLGGGGGSPRYNKLKSLLMEEVYPNYEKEYGKNKSPFDDQNKPQYRALRWLLREDDPEYIDDLLSALSSPTPSPPTASIDVVGNETDDGSSNVTMIESSTTLVTSTINSTAISIVINETDGTTSIKLVDTNDSGNNHVNDEGDMVEDPKVVLVDRYLAVLLYLTTTSDGDWSLPQLARSRGLSTCDWNTESLAISSTTDHAMGFMCNGGNGKYVTSIKLGSNNLSGKIMSEIGSFRYLQVLHLDNNKLEGSIPKEIGQLRVLRELILTNNSLDSLTTEGLKDGLPALRKLHLQNNRIIITSESTEDAIASVGSVLCDRRYMTNELMIGCVDYSSISDACPCCTHCCEVNDEFISGKNDCIETRYKQFYDLLSEKTSPGSLYDGTSPQYLALSWLANVDTFLFNKTTGAREYEELDLESKLGLILDRYVLAILYYGMNGPKWVRPLPYLNVSSSSCDWHDGYIDHCHLNGRVQNINLDENNMKGTVPPELSLLSGQLEKFSIVNNGIFGTLPTELGLLTELSILKIEENSISGTLPSQLSRLTELREITAFNNKITGSIPSEMANYDRIKKFRFDTNLLSGTIPSQLLASLKNAEVVYLNSNRLTGSLPSDIGALTDVEELQLSLNELSDTIPSELGLLTKLVTLSLDSNKFKGQLPSELGALTSLRILRVNTNELTGTLPTHFGRLSNLEGLYTSLNVIAGSIPTQFGLLTSLQFLEIDRNKLVGTIPSELGNMSNLKAFRIYRNFITGSLPTEIGRYTSVTDFEPDSNRLTGSIPTEIGMLRDIERLFFNENYITGPLPSEMGLLSNLELFIFRHTYISGLIPTEFAQLSYLETLSFRHTNITGNVEEVICRDDFVWDGVFSDCVEEVECSCCVNCCTNDECCDRQGENCYSNKWEFIHE